MRVAFAPIACVLGMMLWLPAALQAQHRSSVFEHLTTDDDLSSNGINTILHDSQGFMWFGTPSGLSQHDGYRFTTYTNLPLDSASLAHNWIYQIYEDRSGVLWVGTRGGGLDRFDRETGTFSHYKREEGTPFSLSDNDITALHEDHTGAFWIGTESGGLNKMDRTTGRFTAYQHEADNPQSLSANTVFDLYEDRAGTLWIGTRHGLDRLDRATGTFDRFEFDEAPNPRDVLVEEIYEDREGMFWLGTGDGLMRLDPATRRFQFFNNPARANQKQEIFAIHEDRAGFFWIGAISGLDHFDPATGQWTPIFFGEDHEAGTYSIKAIDEDPSGVLWFGTEDRGLYKFDPARACFAHYQYDPNHPQSLSDPHVKALYEDRAGALWIGTRDGLNRVDRTTGVNTQYKHEARNPQSLSGNIITQVFEDHEGGLWVIPYSAGLNRLDRVTGAVERFMPDRSNPHSLSGTVVRAIYESPAEPGVLWVGTKKGLDRLDVATGRFSHYQHDPADPTTISHNSTRFIYEDRAGTLWIGTDGGLNAFDRASGTFIRYQHEQGNPHSLSHNEVRAILEDRAGTLWIGTKGALNKFVREEGRFVWYTEEEGLADNLITGLVEDEKGYLWLCTNEGISKFDPAQETFRNYNHENGLINTLFEYNACIMSRSGHVFVGGNNGVDFFQPDSLQDNRHVPPIVITDFKKQGRSVAFNRVIQYVEEIRLSHTENFFSFEFAALDYRDPSNNQYAYQLEGLDDDWVYAGTSRSANYTDVRPGTYVFRAKGSNNDGLWNEEGVAVRVIITPPVWRQWWFHALVVFLAVGLLLGAYQYRVRSITERNRALQKEIGERTRIEADRERLIAVLEDKNDELEDKNTELEARNAEMERFTYTVSHDLKTPLVTIKGFLGLLRQDTARGDTERANQDIEKIGNAADKMARLLKELLELSRIGRQMNPPEAVSLTELAHEAADLVAGRIVACGVAVEIDPAMPVVAGDRMRLLEVYQNLIDNAVKFMGNQPAPCVEIAARVNGEEVLCSVRDNGMGIDPMYHEKIFGLFDRLDAQAEGTGIGLALVKRIVEVHGGCIWVESDGEGQGATFWFTLPPNGQAERR